MGGTSLTPSGRQILGYIAAESVRTGECFASKKAIARAVRCSEKTVDRAVAYLKANGYIVVEPCFNDCGAQEGNRYRVLTKAEGDF